MNFLLEITKENYGDVIVKTEGFGDTALFGLQMLGLGMGAVFAVLCLIWGCLTIFGLVFDKSRSKTDKKAIESTPQAPTAPVNTANQNDEIVAVIAAAIAMAESESSGTKFRVVSFKRK